MIKKTKKPIRFMVHCAAKNDFSNIPNLKMKRRMQLNTVKIGTKYAMFPKTKLALVLFFILLQNKKCFQKQNQRFIVYFIE
jgi:hypothetical protein